MRKKNTIWISLIIPLFLSMAMVQVSIIEAEPSFVITNTSSVEVIPSSVEGHYVSETFNVSVYFRIENVTGVGAPPGTPGGLYGFEYKFSWNETLINVTSWTVHIPPTWLSYFKAKDLTDINATTGLRYHWVAVAGIAGPPPASPYIGNMSICDYEFHVEYAPYYPEPDMNCSLNIYGDKLSDKAAKPITHNTFDGFYFIKREMPPPPELEIKEKSIVGFPEGPVPCGELFNVSVQIKDLAWEWRLMGWEAKLGYNTTLLDAVASYEGPFLPPFAGPNGTFYLYKIYDAAGYIHTADLFAGLPATWPNGTGVVAIIEFNATYQTVYPEKLECNLTLYATKLADVNGKPINHTVLPPSTYQAPYKENIPPTIGVPSRKPEGDVLPGQAVKVSVNVTDNESGVKNVTLSYTINNGTSWNNLPMTYNSTSGLYEASIPGQLAWTWVKFKIIAYDNAENNATRDGTAPYCVYQVIPEFPSALMMPLFVFATLVAVILGKTVWSRKRRSPFVAR